MRKWILYGVLAVIVYLAASKALIRFITFSSIRNSPEYIAGMNTFKASERAHELLGDHLIAAKGYPKENSHKLNGSGEAELDVPVSGDARGGTLYIRASERSGIWQITELSLRLEGQSAWNDILPSETK